MVTHLTGWMENLPVARGAEVGVVLSAATVAQVDLLCDARHPLDRPRDLVQAAGDDRGAPRIDLPVRDRADVVDALSQRPEASGTQRTGSTRAVRPGDRWNCRATLSSLLRACSG